MTVETLQKQHDDALAEAETIVAAAESQKRKLTNPEQEAVDTRLKKVKNLKPQIDAAKANAAPTKSVGELRAELAKQPRMHVPRNTGDGKEPMMPDRFSRSYYDGFMSYLSGRAISAAMYEGTSSAGGYAVPVEVDGQVVSLAPQEMAIRRLATVIPTQTDKKLPIKTALGTAAIKTEQSNFVGTAPTLGQFVLSAFVIGAQDDLSFEIAEDAVLFKEFCMDDLSTAIQEIEESLYLSGTGVGQPQGLLGNIGAGVTEEPDANGNMVSISGTLDLIGTLNATYYPNASWVMSRATAIGIRKAQAGAGLFESVWTRVGTQDYLHGFPVYFSAAMPTAARGNTPVIFGDVAKAYLIGDRGGPAIQIKILDQAKAMQGLLTILAFRRTDGRVRRSEALQQYTVAAS